MQAQILVPNSGPWQVKAAPPPPPTPAGPPGVGTAHQLIVAGAAGTGAGGCSHATALNATSRVGNDIVHLRL